MGFALKCAQCRMRKRKPCLECRRRKQKCNRKQPCNNCARRYPQVDCIYEALQEDLEETISRNTSTNSLVSLLDSVFSLPSVSSNLTVPDLGSAYERVVAILRNDPLLKSLYELASTRTTPTKFCRKFWVLLKSFAVDLEREATSWSEQRAAQFIRSRARKLAGTITDVIYVGTKEGQKRESRLLLDAMDIENSDNSNFNEYDEFGELEWFIYSSGALGTMRTSLRRFLDSKSKFHHQETIGQEFEYEMLLPFATEDSLDGMVTSSAHTYSPGPDRSGLSRFWSDIVESLLPKETQIVKGLTRVRWKCACVQNLYDDYVELRPDAAKDLESFLQRSSHSLRKNTRQSWAEGIKALGGALKHTLFAARQKLRNLM